MRRSALLLVTATGAAAGAVACEAPARPVASPPAPAWAYPPPPGAGPLPPVSGRIGRAQAPVPGPRLGVTAAPGVAPFPLRLPTAWPVPGDGPARAVVYGLEGVVPAVELVDVDRGEVVWRDKVTCAGPVVGVTAEAIVCADASGVRGLGLDGKAAWRSEAPYIAMTDDRVVVGPTGLAVTLDAATGEERARVALPAGVLAEQVIAACGDGRELFATDRGGALVRIADARGQPAVTWTAQVGGVTALDACAPPDAAPGPEGDEPAHVIVSQRDPRGGGRLIALARATGVETGRVEGVRGSWAARDGGAAVEVATAGGVHRWTRDLARATSTGTLPPLGELLDARGDRRLVRASPRTAVVLDAAGVRAYVPLATLGAVLGDAAILGASWQGSAASALWRTGLPPRYPRALRLPGTPGGVALPAELRDLPAPAPVRGDDALALPDAARHGVAAIAVDPAAPAVVYALAQAAPPSDAARAGLAAVDLAARRWTWQRSDACGPGAPVGIAVAAAVVACAARGEAPGTASVLATTRAGHAAWAWEADTVDAIAAAGDVVLAWVAERVVVLDAATGRARGQLASDDGGPLPALPVVAGGDAAGATLVIAAERGRIVARLPAAGLLPVWAVAVDGVVRAMRPAPGGVLVELEDGDAVRLDAATGQALTVPGLGLAWLPFTDLLAGATAGGPIPGPPVAAPPPAGEPPRRGRGRRGPPPPRQEGDPPRLWTPVEPPPPLGPSWQLTLYDPEGGLRARNDYGLLGAQPADARGPAGSPIVVAAGGAGRAGAEAAPVAALVDVLVIDPRTGDPLRRAALHRGAWLFSTVVDGSPVAGAVLPAPLRVVLF